MRHINLTNGALDRATTSFAVIDPHHLPHHTCNYLRPVSLVLAAGPHKTDHPHKNNRHEIENNSLVILKTVGVKNGDESQTVPMIMDEVTSMGNRRTYSGCTTSRP